MSVSNKIYKWFMGIMLGVVLPVLLIGLICTHFYWNGRHDGECEVATVHWQLKDGTDQTFKNKQLFIWCPAGPDAEVLSNLSKYYKQILVEPRMRINIYSQELTDEVQTIEKQSNTGLVYSAVQFMLHSSVRLHHPPADDDRSAVTFWLPRSAERREELARAFEIAAAKVRGASPETGLD
jgi:hypothetical protein